MPQMFPMNWFILSYFIIFMFIYLLVKIFYSNLPCLGSNLARHPNTQTPFQWLW